MKKRYGLENIIGKKSKIRFPSMLVYLKTVNLYIYTTAYAAEAEPPLSMLLQWKREIGRICG